MQLRIIGGNERDRVIPLLTKEVILGRAASARAKVRDGQVYLTDPTVSRTHCSLLWDHRKRCYVLTHLSRTNSTKVDGERVERAPLTIGSKIQMGHVVLQVEPISASYAVEAEEPLPAPGTWELPAEAPPPAPGSWELPAEAPLAAPGAWELPAEAPPPPPSPLEVRPHKLPDYIPPIPKVAHPAPPPPRRRSVPLNPDPAPPADPPQKPSRAGWRMAVVEGPDKGIVVPLNAPEMLLGRTMGLADPRYGHAVLIGDSSIPYEQALLRWEDAEGSYVVEVNGQGLPMTIHRATGQDLSLDPGDSMMLLIGDRLEVGKSVLELEQIKRRS